MRLGSLIPNFKAETTTGPIQFYEWLGDSLVHIFIKCYLINLPKMLKIEKNSSLKVVNSDLMNREIDSLLLDFNRNIFYGLPIEISAFLRN